MTTPYQAPQQGEAVTLHDGTLHVPSYPIIPFVEGDGTGPDIWRASSRIFDAAVEKVYGGERKIMWMEVLAGEKGAKKQFLVIYRICW
jgi:isocitrate dehydrogenase